jgi:hypothetical protein
VTVWPVSTAPFESRKLADSWADPPGINSDESGAMTTDETAGRSHARGLFGSSTARCDERQRSDCDADGRSCS